MNDRKDTCCDLCMYYNYDETTDSYYCEVNLDEDDMVRFMSNKMSNCPFFRLNDDYKTVRKQN